MGKKNAKIQCRKGSTKHIAVLSHITKQSFAIVGWWQQQWRISQAEKKNQNQSQKEAIIICTLSHLQLIFILFVAGVNMNGNIFRVRFRILCAFNSLRSNASSILITEWICCFHSMRCHISKRKYFSEWWKCAIKINCVGTTHSHFACHFVRFRINVCLIYFEKNFREIGENERPSNLSNIWHNLKELLPSI